MTKQRSAKQVRGVYEREPGVWWIQYFAGGVRHREKAGTKSNAIDLYRKRKTETLGGQKLKEKLRAKAVTFTEIANAALEYSRKEKRSHEHDTYRMAPLSEHFGPRPAENILPEEFEAWLNEQAEEREWSPATKNRYTALLKLTYRLAEKNRKVKVNPARFLRMPKENNTTVRYLNQYKPLPTKTEYLKGSETEEDRLRAVIAKEFPNHLLEFEIALATGMRRSEMYGATWDKVDLEHDLLTVPRSKHGETRHVTLNSSAKAMLKFLRQNAGESEFVFLSMRNKEPLTGNRHWFEDAVKRAGIKHFTWHCLRHSFGSRLASRGIDLRKIQELMGHKTISMTVRYTHLSQPELLAAVEQLVPLGKPSATKSATEVKFEDEVRIDRVHQVIVIQ